MRLAPLVGVTAAAVVSSMVAVAPAAAAERFFLVRLPDDSVAIVRMDVGPDVPAERVRPLPGALLQEVEKPPPGTPVIEAPPARPGRVAEPRGTPAGRAQPRERSRERARKRGERRRGSGRSAQRASKLRDRAPRRRRSGARRRTRFFDRLPAPGAHIPDAVLSGFRVPIFLLPIFKAAGREYGIRWHILAAINEIETNYGRNLNVSSAGAVGWMQFMPATWRAYGVDANRDGRRDPYNPVDAIFAAARYLAASGYARDVRRAIFAYNHAHWYVESVLLRARLIAGLPTDVVGTLSGLAGGRFPIAARSRYLRDLSRGRARPHRSIEIFSRRGAPVVAVNDGVVRRLGRARRLGRFVVLEDARGNRYTYAGLGAIARVYPWPRRAGARLEPRGRPRIPRRRLFAHPYRPNARNAGGLEQILDARATERGFAVYTNPYLRGFGRGARNARLKRLRRGSHVLEGTVLGRVGRARRGMAAHLRFGMRPPGRRARGVDPRPVLDGWRLLESARLYRDAGRAGAFGAGALGGLLTMPKPLLERRVLDDRRIAIYPCGRGDIRAGRIDRRVLATLVYLADSGLRPAVTSLRCGHSYYTSSGNVSHHSSGNAVDIAMLNGVPVLGHQGRGGVTWRAVRRLTALEGRMRPAQIISLLALGGNTLAMRDHDDHIHVGFAPRPGDGSRVVRAPDPILGPDQWERLIDRLRRVRNPRLRRRG